MCIGKSASAGVYAFILLTYYCHLAFAYNLSMGTSSSSARPTSSSSGVLHSTIAPICSTCTAYVCQVHGSSKELNLLNLKSIPATTAVAVYPCSVPLQCTLAVPLAIDGVYLPV